MSGGVHGKRRTGIEIQPQLQFRGIGHSARMPGRIENDLGVDFSDLGQLRQLAFDISPEDVSHAAAGGGHRHFDFDFLTAALDRRDPARVDQPEIYDIDRDFGIVDGLQPVPNELFAELDRRGLRLFWIGSES